MDVNFYLQAGPINAPKNWQDVRIKMTWNDNVQPYIEMDEFTFVNEHISLIQDHLNNSGLFEGMPFGIQVVDTNNVYNFDGFLDLTTLKYVSPSECTCKVVWVNDVDSWKKKFESVSYGYLAQEKALFSKSDYVRVPVIVKSKFDATEVSIALLGTLIIAKEIAEFIKNTTDEASKLGSATAYLTGAGGSILMAVLTVLYHLAYYALMTIALKKFSDTINQQIAPKKVHYNGVRLKVALEKACKYFKLDLVTNIDDLYHFVYIPSKADEKLKSVIKDSGIPHASDYGYQLSEMVELIIKLFAAKIDIRGGVMYVYNENDPIWRQPGAGNIMPSHSGSESYSYNASEMMANRVISFQYDSSDVWTMPSENKKNDYSKGTNFQVICDFDSTNLIQLGKMNKGLEEISIPLALGKRRDKLTFAEEAIKVLNAGIDKVVGLMGGTSLADKINDNRGCLLIEKPGFNIAKIVYIGDDGLIPANHREYLSARALYDHYYQFRSFVAHPELSKHRDFVNDPIPFGLVEFAKYLESPYFTCETDNSPISGKEGKLREIEWHLGGDSAIANFFVYENYQTPQIKDYWIES